MKAKLLKLLRLVGYVVPFFVGLIEKLALGLIKKSTSLANWARNYLNRVKTVCDCPETFAEIADVTGE
ncbi:MAG: hypothetical protein IJ329_02850 [Clostridia bacterium]|nr:hypothetical protein [Clostridia bacterium]